MDKLLAFIEERWRLVLRRLAQGDDVPPAMALRLEGMLEAAVLLGATDPEALDQRLAALYQAERGVSLEEHLGADWREAMPFPALPVFMARAPVYPSTAD